MTLYRVLHDFERADLHYRSRFWNPKARKQRGLPETVRLRGGSSNVRLTDAAMEYWARINGQNPTVMKYLLRLDSGIINRGFVGFTWHIVNGILRFAFKGKDRPMMECLTFGGSIFYGTQQGQRVYVDSLLHIDKPFPIYKTFPPVQRFGAITQDGTLQEPPCGAAYTFLLARAGERLWIDAGCVEVA